jgi:hypothetical protein
MSDEQEPLTRSDQAKRRHPKMTPEELDRYRARKAFLAGHSELPPLSTQTLAGRDPLLEKLREQHGKKL